MVNNAKNHKKYVSKPSFVCFSKNYIAINEIKPVLTLVKPIYAGFRVLEFSKCEMYDFHHNYIKRKFDA